MAIRVVGEWLSLVEHLVRDQGVGGSNPLSPTNCFQLLTVLPVGPLVLAKMPQRWKPRKHWLSRHWSVPQNRLRMENSMSILAGQR
jgi:hypothetical protein